jgi:hypothetical protein
MFTARKKIAKEKGQEPDSFEEQVAQVLLTATDQTRPTASRTLLILGQLVVLMFS